MSDETEYISPVTKRYAAVVTAIALPYYLHFPGIVSFAEGAKLGFWKVSNDQTFYWLNFGALVFATVGWVFRAFKEERLASYSQSVKESTFSDLVGEYQIYRKEYLDQRRTRERSGESLDVIRQDPSIVKKEHQIMEIHNRIRMLRSNEFLILWQSHISYVWIPAGLVGASLILTVFDYIGLDLNNRYLATPILTAATLAITVEIYRLAFQVIRSAKLGSALEDPLNKLRLVVDTGDNPTQQIKPSLAHTMFHRAKKRWNPIHRFLIR